MWYRKRQKDRDRKREIKRKMQKEIEKKIQKERGRQKEVGSNFRDKRQTKINK